MQVEVFDEILAPQRCARCGHAFPPPPDAVVFCPACHACHVGLAIPEGLQGARLARAWLKSFSGEDRIQFGSGYHTHRTAGRLHIVHDGQSSRTSSGFAALVERGQTDGVPGPPYVILRLAAFPPAGATTSGISLPEVQASVAPKPWGLELIAHESSRDVIEQRGYDAVLELMARVALESGYEPVSSRPAPTWQSCHRR